jgi:hypothetical protein
VSGVILDDHPRPRYGEEEHEEVRRALREPQERRARRFVHKLLQDVLCRCTGPERMSEWSSCGDRPRAATRRTAQLAPTAANTRSTISRYGGMPRRCWSAVLTSCRLSWSSTHCCRGVGLRHREAVSRMSLLSKRGRVQICVSSGSVSVADLFMTVGNVLAVFGNLSNTARLKTLT